MKENRFIPYIMLLMAIVSIQFGASLAKGLFTSIGAIGTAGLRLLLASLILSLIFKPWKLDFKSFNLKIVMVYGACLGIMNILFYLSLERIPLGIAVALEFTGPLGVSFLLTRRLKEFIWPILAVIGVILLIPFKETSSSLDPIGMLYALGAGVSWGLYIVFGKKASKDLSGGKAVSLGMFFAALSVLPFTLINKKVFDLEFDLLPLALSVAILSSALPYTLEMFVLKKMQPKNFGILMSLEPAVATFFGFIYLKEDLTGIHLIAIGLIILASLGSTLLKKGAEDEILNDPQ